MIFRKCVWCVEDVDCTEKMLWIDSQACGHSRARGHKMCVTVQGKLERERERKICGKARNNSANFRLTSSLKSCLWEEVATTITHFSPLCVLWQAFRERKRPVEKVQIVITNEETQIDTGAIVLDRLYLHLPLNHLIIMRSGYSALSCDRPCPKNGTLVSSANLISAIILTLTSYFTGEERAEDRRG